MFKSAKPMSVSDFRDLGVEMIRALARDQGLHIKRVEFEETVPVTLSLDDCRAEKGPPWYKCKVEFEQDPGSVFQTERTFAPNDEPPEQ